MLFGGECCFQPRATATCTARSDSRSPEATKPLSHAASMSSTGAHVCRARDAHKVEVGCARGALFLLGVAKSDDAPCRAETPGDLREAGVLADLARREDVVGVEERMQAEKQQLAEGRDQLPIGHQHVHVCMRTRTAHSRVPAPLVWRAKHRARCPCQCCVASVGRAGSHRERKWVATGRQSQGRGSTLVFGGVAAGGSCATRPRTMLSSCQTEARVSEAAPGLQCYRRAAALWPRD